MKLLRETGAGLCWRDENQGKSRVGVGSWLCGIGWWRCRSFPLAVLSLWHYAKLNTAICSKLPMTDSLSTFYLLFNTRLRT